jgi:hypothetical protein
MASKLPYIVVPTPVDGVRADLPWQLLPPTSLVDAENVVLRDGMIVLRPGLLHHSNLDENLSPAPEANAVFGVASYLQADSSIRDVVWHKMTDDGMGVVTGQLTYSTAFTAEVTASGAGSGLEQGPISWRIFPLGTPIENFLVWCNGRDAQGSVIQVWDSESDAMTFGAVANAPKCNAIMILAETLIALGLPESDSTGTDLGGSGWRVSSHLTYAFPATPRQEGILADTPGEIVAAHEMGLLRGAVFKTDSIYVFSAGSSTDAPFTTELAAQGIDGPMNRVSLCSGHDGIIYWISRSCDLWQFDGVNARIVTPAFKALFLNLVGSSPELDQSALYRNTDTTGPIWLTFDRQNQELVARVGVATQSGVETPVLQTIGLRVKLDGKYSLWPQRWRGDVQAAVSYIGGFGGGFQSPAIFVGSLDNGDNGHVNIGYEGHWSGAGGLSDRAIGTDDSDDTIVWVPGYVNRTHDKFVEELTPATFTEEFYDITGYIRYSSLKPPTDDPYRIWMFQENDWDFVQLSGITSFGALAPTETTTVWAQSHSGQLLDTGGSTGERSSGYMFGVKIEWETNLVEGPTGEGVVTVECSSLGPFFVGGRMHVAPRGFRR